MTREELDKLYGVYHAGPRVAQFLTDLHYLCLKHRVTIRPSGYDRLNIFDLDDDKPIWCAGITDYTKEWCGA
jgi:hypothetical protein